MTRLLVPLLASLVIAGAGVLAAPSVAVAQCQWGCTCMENACGCNRHGSGSRCDLGGDGCVVVGCLPTNELGFFAPDGSFVSGASTSTVPEPQRAADADGSTALAITAEESFRWESISPGRSVARHWSGVILARYFDRAVAAEIRERSRSFTI